MTAASGRRDQLGRLPRFVTALETNDAEWTDFNTQDFDEGPFEMALDSVNGILYSANIRAGVFALKLK